MLVISRKPEQSIVIQDSEGRQLVIRVTSVGRGAVKLAFAQEEGVQSFEIWREEIAESKLSAIDHERQVKKESSDGKENGQQNATDQTSTVGHSRSIAEGDRGSSEEVRRYGKLREQHQDHDEREAQEARSTKANDH